MVVDFSEKAAQKEYEKRHGTAKKLLADQDAIERFLQRLEKKLKTIPLAGDVLANIPIMASLIRSFIKKEYLDIPIGSIISIMSALIYFVSPLDFIPDLIPIAGYADDASVVAICLKLVESDVEEYSKWRKKNGKDYDL